MSCTGAVCGSSDEDRVKGLQGKHLHRRNYKRGKRNAAAASASVSQLAADDGNVSQLAAHGGNVLRTLQLTRYDEVGEKDVQNVGFTPHAYSKLAEVYGIRAKLAERELSVLNEARLQNSNWAHHASMSQRVSMALASICSERGGCF